MTVQQPAELRSTLRLKQGRDLLFSMPSAASAKQFTLEAVPKGENATQFTKKELGGRAVVA